MIDFKIYNHNADSQINFNLISGVVPQERIITDIREAYDYDGALFIMNNSIISNDYNEEVFKFRQENDKLTKLIVDYSYETGLSEDDFNTKVKKIVSKGIDFKDTLFILNRSAYSPWLDKHINQVHFIDLFAVSAVVRHVIHKMPVSTNKIEERPLKANLLLGKVNKESRRKIINAFYKSSLREKTIFSFLGKLDDNNLELVQLVNDNQGPIDGATPIKLGHETSSQGWSNDTIVYDTSSVSFICETHELNDSLFITEKTYRPIINRHPFIARASFPLIQYLKAIGFKTFDEFIDEDYDKKNDVDDSYADLLVQRAEELLKSISDNKDQIENIVNHNYEVLVKFAESELIHLNQRLFALLK